MAANTGTNPYRSDYVADYTVERLVNRFNDGRIQVQQRSMSAHCELKLKLIHGVVRIHAYNATFQLAL
ncbi:hypothetical protein [Bradyrhizobium sp. CB3481]|uniref:hypothetical protein n=1 Tax=Bradyrhizobium sp. CB3481 TaxID=3039158 RepID=UPI0024B08BD7|nr:hypothetical protein [Bradyrhizobium sp. CB3481]WFU14880.1 hypothetical protein QA643_28160 [Bradyrhizobium sp. CB3481]